MIFRLLFYFLSFFYCTARADCERNNIDSCRSVYKREQQTTNSDKKTRRTLLRNSCKLNSALNW